MNNFYNELEQHILDNLKKNYSKIPELGYGTVLKYFRQLDLDSRLLEFLFKENVLTECLLNIIHYNLSHKIPFSSKSKYLDLGLLFDFNSKEKYLPKKFWVTLNDKFLKSIKY